jgi:cytoskeletal protein CcmA (bactofilin family)
VDQAHIGKGMVITGQISGAEPLFVDGSVEGSISLPGNLVTIGPNGQVMASISARDVVVLGKVWGDIIASNRLDIRSEGSVTGDVLAARLSIEQGGFIKGRVAVEQAGIEAATAPEPVAVEARSTRLVVEPDAGKLRRQPVALTA